MFLKPPGSLAYFSSLTEELIGGLTDKDNPGGHSPWKSAQQVGGEEGVCVPQHAGGMQKNYCLNSKLYTEILCGNAHTVPFSSTNTET